MPYPTAKFNPASGAVATESDLLFLKDYVAGDSIPALAVAMGIDDTFFDVVAGTENQLPLENFIAVIGTEHILVGQNCRAGVRCSPVVREYAGTTKAIHPVGARVNAFWTAAHHNQAMAEILAMQEEMRREFLLTRTPVGPNLLANPNFDADSTGWTVENASRVTTPSPHIETTVGVEDAGLRMVQPTMRPGVTPGSTIVMALDVLVNDASQLLRIGFGEYSAGQTWLRTAYPIANDTPASSLGLVPNIWKRLSGQITIGSDAAFLSMTIRGNRAPGIAGAQAGFDEIFIGEVTQSAFA